MYLFMCRLHKELGIETFEPRNEKTGLLHNENKDADQLRSNCADDQRLCLRCTDSKSLYYQPSSVAAQPGLCRTWSETPKTGFLTTRLI